MEENTKGISSAVILILIAVIVLAAGIFYVVTQMGPAPSTTQPSPTMVTYPTPGGTPVSGLNIQSVQDLDNATKDLNSADVDGSMNADLNGLSTDSTGL